MSQGPSELGAVDEAVGYVLKQVATVLRTTLDAALRPLDLTTPQYSCLEVLGQRPGLSASELARAVFVSRQAMHQLLRGLAERGLTARPDVPDRGRALPTELTDEGRRVLEAASAVAAGVEQRMTDGFDAQRRARFLADLRECAAALGAATP